MSLISYLLNIIVAMRRREKFIIIALFLGLCLWLVQFVPIAWRSIAIFAFGLLAYFASALALSANLNARIWLTYLTLPALHSIVIGFFYFLLPTNFWSLIIVLGFFSFSIYALFLTGNILAPREKKIQLSRAAQNTALFFTAMGSLLSTQVIFSFNLPFYLTPLLVFVIHFFLLYTIIWSIDPNEKINFANLLLTFFSALLIAEITLTLAFLPITPWHLALLSMASFYLIACILTTYLSEKFFQHEIAEYLLLTIFILLMFGYFFPGK